MRSQVRARDLLQALDLLRVHEFAALVASRDERELFVERGELPFELGARGCAVGAVGDALPVVDLRVALEHLEAHADLVDAVVDRLQLGGLVHHVLGRGHLAAIVQPARDVQRFPLLVGQVEVLERPFFRGARRFGEHEGELGHALAVSARVGRFGVDRPRHQTDEGVEQRLAGFEQALRLDRHRGGARQRLGEREPFRTGDRRTGREQRQYADRLACAVAERDRDHDHRLAGPQGANEFEVRRRISGPASRRWSGRCATPRRSARTRPRSGCGETAGSGSPAACTSAAGSSVPPSSAVR